MAADFNAGSIEGTLELDTRPFVAGLEKAKAQAANFERQKFKATADLDTTELSVKDRVANEKLDRLDHKKVTAKADLDISEAEAKAAILSRTLSHALDAGGLGKHSINPAMFLGKFTAIVGGLLSIVAAAGPAGAAMVGFGGASVAALGGAEGALALFTKVAESDFSRISNAAKKGLQLSGPAGLAERALEKVQHAWSGLLHATAGPVFGVMTAAFQGAAGILPRLVPLIDTVGRGVKGLVQDVVALTKQPIFAQFLSQLQSFMHGFLAGAGPVLTSLLSGFMHSFIVLRPLMAQLGQGIAQLASAGAHFASGGGLAQFVGYVEKETPHVLALVHALFTALGHLGQGLAPLAGPALHFITALVAAIGHINIAPFARGFGEVLRALEPMLPVLATLINTLLKPFGALLGAIAHGPLAAITHSLRGELAPAFSALRGILGALVHPLAQFLGSIANLANPTGIHLAATLLRSLEGVVRTIAPALGHLAVALESVIDNGINALLPILPRVAPLLRTMATAAAAVANGLAAILAHRTVSVVLLGLVAAVMAGVKAFRLYRATMAGIEAVQAAYATAMLGSAAATEAGGLSLAIYRARLIATRVAAIAVAAAQKAMAAAQWILNAAMDANPIGLVVIAIAALAAGLIYAWKHSQTFRDIVTGAFHAVEDVARTVFNWLSNAVGNVIDFIRSHWQLLVGIFLGPLGIVLGLVIGHFSQIRSFISNVISSVVSFVRNGLDNVVSFFGSLPGRIAGFFGSMVSAGVNLFEGVFDGIKNVGAQILSWCASLPGRIIGAIGNIGGQVLNSVEGSISSSLSGIGSFIKGHIPHLASGGVTTGPMLSMIGDNSSGREAVVPLDEYDLPRRGQVGLGTAATLSGLDALRQQMTAAVDVLRKIADKTATSEEIGKAAQAMSSTNMRRMVQIARAQ